MSQPAIMRRESAPKEEPRFTVDFDQKSLRAIALVVFSAFWIYTALLTLPFTYWMPVINLDGSHQFGSNYFPNAGFRYGSDLIFTFGPLGYLIYPENIGNHVAVANVLRGVIWLLLLSHLILLYRVGMRGTWKSLLLMLAIIPARNLLLGSFDYYALAVLVVLILYTIEQPKAWVAPVSIVFIAALLSVTKFTGYILALACIGLMFTARSDWPPKPVRRKDVYFALAALGAFPVVFLMHNPSLAGLFNYIYGSLHLSSGYNEAMSLPTGASDIFYAASLGTLFVFGVAYASAKGALPWRVAPVLILVYWLNFKHGFVRGDDHTPMAYCFEIVLAAVLICLLRPAARRVTLQYAAAFPFFAVVALSGTNLHWSGVWTEGYWSSANTRQTLGELMQWNETTNRIDEEKKKTDEFQQLPQTFRTRLEGATATVFPWEIAYVRSGHFKLRPLYTMQSYAAFTEYLDRKTAEHLRADRDRSEYVLFDWQSIDDRHPLLDVPATWTALVDNYEPAEVSSGKILLKRRPSPLDHKLETRQRLQLPIGKWIDLPETNKELWGKILVPYSASGWLRKTAYKTNPLYLSVRSHNLNARFRVVPGVLFSPIPLNAFPVDFESFLSLLQSKRVEDPITGIRLDTQSPGDFEEPSLDLLEETESQLTFADYSQKSFQSEFHLASPSAITKVAEGGVDVLNGARNPATLPDEKHPLTITTGTKLRLEGWLADRRDGRAFDEIYAVVNGRLLRGTAVARTDVAAYFKNPGLDRSGFRIEIGADDVTKGIQKIDLVGVMNPDRSVYRFRSSLYAEFQ